jgi:hypothetical protein
MKVYQSFSLSLNYTASFYLSFLLSFYRHYSSQQPYHYEHER